MAKIRFNSLVRDVSGGFENVVFRARNGKVVMARRSDLLNEPTAGQLAQRERFRDATAYGKIVMADPDLLAFYKAEAKERDIPVFALTIADFFNPPSIRQIDLAEYHGQVGDMVSVKVTDDFGVNVVNVTLVNAQTEQEIEHGRAIETGAGSGLWHYTAKTVVAAGTEVKVNVVAADRPGGTALETQTKTL
jgi:hypothetical protein